MLAADFRFVSHRLMKAYIDARIAMGFETPKKLQPLSRKHLEGTYSHRITVRTKVSIKKIYRGEFNGGKQAEQTVAWTALNEIVDRWIRMSTDLEAFLFPAIGRSFG